MGRNSIENVELVFENCESVEVPLRYIGYLILNNITQRISRTHSGAPELRKCAKEFAIEIDRKFDKESLERVSRPCSITYVEITFGNGVHQEYVVSWGEGDHDNEYQTAKFNKHGDLFIVVSENPESADRIFPNKTINP